MVKVHAAEALLIVDGHSHLLKMIDLNCDNDMLIPRKNQSSSFKDAWIRCKIPKTGVSGLAEFAGYGETISFVLTGGISVLMCLSVGKTKAVSKYLVGHQERLEVVTLVNDCDSSDREWRKG